MSRTKKSRTPSVGKRETVKETSKTSKADIIPNVKKPKKKTGNQPGNRQQEGLASNYQNKDTSGPKDPRIGSKTLIDLTPKSAPKANKPRKEKPSPIAAIRMIEPIVEPVVTLPTSELEDELYAIEEDAQLQQILALQEDDIELNEEQINYFNQKMERHQELRELLGWSDDEDDEDEAESDNKSEDDLWNTLDNNDLSKF